MMVQQTTTPLDAALERHGATHAAQDGMLPADFRAAFAAFVTYLDHRDPAAQVDAAAATLEDLAVLFAQAAADGVPLRDVVGHNPADVAEDLLDTYAPAPHDTGARRDLARAIDAIAAGRFAAG